jgi:ABC-2 type transport system permease protein
MTPTLDVAARELRSLFVTPLAWVVLGVLQFVVAWAFFLQVDRYLELQPQLVGLDGAPGVTAIVVSGVLAHAGQVLLLVTPLLTMRLLAEERRAGTLVLLLSAPVSSTAIVLGKFLAVMAFFVLVLLVLCLMPLALLVGGSLDPGLFAASVLGVALMSASFVAAGLFFSTLTRQPAIAAVATFGVLLMLLYLHWVNAGEGGPLA